MYNKLNTFPYIHFDQLMKSERGTQALKLGN